MMLDELLSLAELGFGLGRECDFGRQRATSCGQPQVWKGDQCCRGGAVLRQMVATPPFVTQGDIGSWDEDLQGLELSGHFLISDVITDQSAPVADGRDRMSARMKRAAEMP